MGSNLTLTRARLVVERQNFPTGVLAAVACFACGFNGNSAFAQQDARTNINAVTRTVATIPNLDFR
jgi:hypothetical protein